MGDSITMCQLGSRIATSESPSEAWPRVKCWSRVGTTRPRGSMLSPAMTVAGCAVPVMWWGPATAIQAP